METDGEGGHGAASGPSLRHLPAVQPAHGAPVEAWNGYFDSQYVVVKVCDKTRILNENGDRYELTAPREMHALYSNKWATKLTPNSSHTQQRTVKLVRAFDQWLNFHSRLTYANGMQLIPNKSVDKAKQLGIYNRWRGFAVEPRPGPCPQILQYLHEVVCASNQEHTDYLLSLLAWKAQHPGEPAEVAIVLQGGEGTGKSTFGELMRSIYGRHYLHVAQSDHLIGNFNALLQDKAVVFADEAFWAGNKQGKSTLKSMVTESELVIERKRIDAISVKNRMLLVMASNARWVTPAGADARRFFVLYLSDIYKQAHAYFAMLRAAFITEMLAFLHYLLNMDISSFNRREVPKTKALFQQKVLTQFPAGSVGEWWLECMRDGRIVGIEAGGWGPTLGQAAKRAWPTEIRKEELRRAFHNYRSRGGGSHRPVSDQAFGMQLAEFSTLAGGGSARQLLNVLRRY